MQTDLIYDFGLHKGFDAEFYLRKGFRVVGLEAVPALAEVTAARLQSFNGQITIINKALYDRGGEIVSFYSVPNKDDWGSLFKGLAEKGVEQSVEIQVETIDLASIFDQHGVPYYLKCDLEGGDRIFIEQLLADQRRPAFVSVEISGGSELEMLGKCGYELAQVINQAFSWQKTPPNPAREGSYAEVSFTHEHSGLFGRELDPARWMPIAEALEVIRMWNELKMHCPDLVPGWADVHVCKPAALA